MRKKLISLFLLLTFFICLIPAAAFAAPSPGRHHDVPSFYYDLCPDFPEFDDSDTAPFDETQDLSDPAPDTPEEFAVGDDSLQDAAVTDEEFPAPPMETPESILAAKAFAAQIQPDGPATSAGVNTGFDISADGSVTVSADDTLFAEEGMVVFNNGGTVFNNSGIVYNNGGVVFNNFGTVYNNAGVVYANGGTTYNNDGIVYNNNALVYNSGADGTVETGPAYDDADIVAGAGEDFCFDSCPYEDTEDSLCPCGDGEDCFCPYEEFDSDFYPGEDGFSEEWYAADEVPEADASLPEDELFPEDNLFPEDEPFPEDELLTDTPDDAFFPDAEDDFLAAYAPVFETYRAFLDGEAPSDTAVTDQGDLYLELGATGVGSLCSADDPLGWCLMDLDGNGIPELLVGTDFEEDDNSLIYDMFTLKNGEVHRVLASSSRASYLLTEDYNVLYESRGAAGDFFCGVYALEDTDIELIAGVLMRGGRCTQIFGSRYQELNDTAAQGAELSEEEFNTIVSVFETWTTHFEVEAFPAYEETDNGADRFDNSPAVSNVGPGEIYDMDELAALAQQYYFDEFGFFPPEADVYENDDGSYTIHLYEIVDTGYAPVHTATSAWYLVDDYGVGIDVLTGAPIALGE